MALADVSTNQQCPSGPGTIARGPLAALGVANSQIEPSIATLATAPPSASLIHTKPKPAVGASGRLPRVIPAENSVIVPAGVMRPT